MQKLLTPKQKAIIICGPTAGGKTDLAHEFALANNGEIINADSMQLYKQIPIITASPSSLLKAETPYHLYNFQDVDKEFSATKYVNAASMTIREVIKRGKLPIIVGGSGMYISMLVGGYSAIPEINEDIRAAVRKLHQLVGGDEFFQQLCILDPAIATILSANDTQRVIRAYEVIKQTGKSILRFQAEHNIKPLPECDFKILLLLPERSLLYDNCNARFIKLLDERAIEEIEALYKQYGDLQTSAMKALGVSEIIAFIKGDITREKAIELASNKTRQYAKRQITWFKNQLNNKQIIEFGNIEEYMQIKQRICTG